MKCIPHKSVGCNPLSLSDIPASGAKILIQGRIQDLKLGVAQMDWKNRGGGGGGGGGG